MVITKDMYNHYHESENEMGEFKIKMRYWTLEDLCWEVVSL